MKSEGEEQVDIFKALESDMTIYSELIVEKEKSIAVKLTNKNSFFIFDASRDEWIEELDITNFKTDNYLAFKFSEIQTTGTKEEAMKLENRIINEAETTNTALIAESNLDAIKELNNFDNIKSNEFTEEILEEVKTDIKEIPIDSVNYYSTNKKEELVNEFNKDIINNEKLNQPQNFNYKNKNLKVYYKSVDINKHSRLIQTLFDVNSLNIINKGTENPENPENPANPANPPNPENPENSENPEHPENKQDKLVNNPECKNQNSLQNKYINTPSNNKKNIQKIINKKKIKKNKFNNFHNKVLSQFKDESHKKGEKESKNEEKRESTKEGECQTNNEVKTEDQNEVTNKINNKPKNKALTINTEFKDIGYFTFVFPIKQISENSDKPPETILKKYIFIISDKKKNAEIDGLLKFPSIGEENKESFYTLPEIIEKYSWKTFRNSVPSLFNMSFEEYKNSFKDLKDTYIIVETKNNSDLFYLSYQIDRCYSHHKGNVLKGKKVIALMAFHFKDYIIDEEMKKGLTVEKAQLKAKYEKMLLEKLNIMRKKGIESLIMLNIVGDEFLTMEKFKSTCYNKEVIREKCKVLKKVEHTEQKVELIEKEKELVVQENQCIKEKMEHMEKRNNKYEDLIKKLIAIKHPNKEISCISDSDIEDLSIYYLTSKLYNFFRIPFRKIFLNIENSLKIDSFISTISDDEEKHDSKDFSEEKYVKH